MKKWHKNCGGKVIHQKLEFRTSFSKAGKCLKCRAFPINEEDIIFEIDDHSVERLNELGEWVIIEKNSLKEKLN